MQKSNDTFEELVNKHVLARMGWIAGWVGLFAGLGLLVLEFVAVQKEPWSFAKGAFIFLIPAVFLIPFSRYYKSTLKKLDESGNP